MDLNDVKKELAKNCPQCEHDCEVVLWFNTFGDRSIAYFCPRCGWKTENWIY